MAPTDSPNEPWVTVAEVAQGDCSPDVAEYSDALLQEAATVASAWLWRLSGRQYPGTSTATVRPITASCACGYGGGWYGSSYYEPPLVDSYTAATNGFWCGCRWGRAREGAPEITLGYYPITEVTAVVVDGTPVSAANYRLDDNRYLVATHGYRWPTTQDFTKDIGEAGTWTVSFRYGLDPPPDGVTAARVLACEVTRWLKGDPCRIPKRATNIARQGVNVALIDPSGLLENGRFGIPEVDAFLNSVNPHRLVARPGIYNVDTMRPLRPATSLPGS